MQPNFGDFLEWLLDVMCWKFSSFHPFHLYKLLMIFWHGSVVIGSFGGFKFTSLINYPLPTNLLIRFKQCFTLICDEIQSNQDWRYLDLFLFGATSILLNEDNSQVITQVNKILRMFDENLQLMQVHDTDSFLVSTPYCCDPTKHGQLEWTPHLYAGMLLVTLVKCW